MDQRDYGMSVFLARLETKVDLIVQQSTEALIRVRKLDKRVTEVENRTRAVRMAIEARRD